MRTLIVTPAVTITDPMIQAAVRLQLPGPADHLIISGDNTHPNRYQNITDKFNKAREVFLRGRYDYMLCLEADVIAPPDAIKKLLDCEADIAYGLICWRHGIPKWSAYVALDDKISESVSDHPELARRNYGRIMDVAGVGQSCTLIKREVLEAVEFRLDDRLNGVSCDWWLAYDAQMLGMTQRANLGVVCGHLKSYDPPWEVIWPDITKERLWTVKSWR